MNKEGPGQTAGSGSSFSKYECHFLVLCIKKIQIPLLSLFYISLMKIRGGSRMISDKVRFGQITVLTLCVLKGRPE